jgi:hypothetical protein
MTAQTGGMGKGVGSAKNATAAKPIKIGAILDFTRPAPDLGPKFKAGIEPALEEAGYEVAMRSLNTSRYFTIGRGGDHGWGTYSGCL